MQRQLEGKYIPFVTYAIEKTLALSEKPWNKLTAQLKFRHENPLLREPQWFTDLGLSGLIRSTEPVGGPVGIGGPKLEIWRGPSY
jgi:hypothetical protein